jgi:RHH-type proline utilization regulon transcriptional repressor/proline dehydrogenase/delta 1-pyrroline-5-carboxylate dehydrogenase
MEEYKDLRLTLEVFKRILGRSDLLHLKAGIVLQAYLPDAMNAMHELQLWARDRRSRGGAPIKVRIVKGANLSMETVDAELHDWPLAVVGSKRAADTNYKHVVNYALTEDHLKNVEVGIAGHNLFDIAFAHQLIKNRALKAGVSFEMLLGMAEAQAQVVSQTVGSLLLYTPVVHPSEFDVAIAYLIRRLEESASSDNFMSAVFELHENTAMLERETERFKLSIAHFDDDFAQTNRVQDRRTQPAAVTKGFNNAPDSDPATPGNKHWAADIFARAQNSRLGQSAAENARITGQSQLDEIISRSLAAAEVWQGTSTANRAALLHELGNQLEAHRGELIEVMISEAGKTFDQADPEVSEAVDFAHYYAERSLELAELDGAQHLPENLVIVTPPWNFPVAIPAGSTIAALAAGSAVLLKPAPQVNRCGALLGEILNKAGLPTGLLTTVVVDEGQLGRELISHNAVDRIVLTGAFETARLFKSFKPELKLIAETSGKNSIIVTESADLDLAAKDVVLSAFGHAGQKCSAASIVILVGSVAKSKRFLNQLVDATNSLVVDYATNSLAQVGPLIERPSEKLLHGLTKLDAGESWLIEPKQLDESGRLWSPGIRQDVRADSPSHLQEYFGPMLSIMTAQSLEQAIELQNGSDYGLTAGIHSLDVTELEIWLDRVEAGNLYINRGITGAIVQRQPFGGWKKSVVGPTAKAGGPNYLLGFGNFKSKPSTSNSAPSKDAAELLPAIKPLVTAETYDALVRSAASDAEAVREIFEPASDASGLKAERNILRYRPANASVRIGSKAADFEAYRLALAAICVGAPISAAELDPQVAKILTQHGCLVTIEPTDKWVASLGASAPRRIRVLGEAVSLGVEFAVYDHAAVESGRIELLPFWREQSIAITDHRFGNPLKSSNRVWN